jgi:hypothetical protein
MCMSTRLTDDTEIQDALRGQTIASAFSGNGIIYLTLTNGAHVSSRDGSVYGPDPVAEPAFA